MTIGTYASQALLCAFTLAACFDAKPTSRPNDRSRDEAPSAAANGGQDGSENTGSEGPDGGVARVTPTTDAGSDAAITEAEGSPDAPPTKPLIHATCKTSVPKDLAPVDLTGPASDAPWFALSETERDCSGAATPTFAAAGGACPFAGFRANLNERLMACVPSDGTLPFTFKNGACVAYGSAEVRRSLCCAGLEGIDCGRLPNQHASAPGELCGRHEDCEHGLVCATDGKIGRCACPETPIGSLRDSPGCTELTGPRAWGDIVRYDPSRSCEPGLEPGVVVETLFDHRVEAGPEQTLPGFVEAAIDNQNRTHVVYLSASGLLVHSVESGDQFDSKVIAQVPLSAVQKVYGVAMALDSSDQLHVAVATEMDALVGSESEDFDFRSIFTWSLPTATLGVALQAEPDGSLLLAANYPGHASLYERRGAYFAPTGVFQGSGNKEDDPGGITLHDEFGVTSLTFGSLGQVSGATRRNGRWGEAQLLIACDAPSASVDLLVCEGGGRGSLLRAATNQPLQAGSRTTVNDSDRYASERTLGRVVARDSERHIGSIFGPEWLVYREPRGIHVRSDVHTAPVPTESVWTSDRTLSRPAATHKWEGALEIFYPVITSSPFHHQLRRARVGVCPPVPVRVKELAIPPPLMPVQHASCADAITELPPQPRVSMTEDGKVQQFTAHTLTCDDVPPARTCDAYTRCFADEVCMQGDSTKPGLCVSQMYWRSSGYPDQTWVRLTSGDCMASLTVEDAATACCSELDGFDCRRYPYAVPSGPGGPCLEHADCESGLVCQWAAEGMTVCGCPGTTPTASAGACDAPTYKYIDWVDGPLPDLEVGECTRTLDPDWSIEAVTGFEEILLVHDAIAGPDGEILIPITKDVNTTDVGTLRAGSWSREVAHAEGAWKALLSLDAAGDPLLAVDNGSQVTVTHRSNGTWTAWPNAFAFTQMRSFAVDGIGLLHFTYDYAYASADRTDLRTTFRLPSENGRVVTTGTGGIYLMSGTLGGSVVGGKWGAAPFPRSVPFPFVPRMSTASKGPVWLVDWTPRGDIRVATTEAQTPTFAWRSLDPNFTTSEPHATIDTTRDGKVWISHMGPSGMRVTTNVQGEWQSTTLLPIHRRGDLVVDSNDEPHILLQPRYQDELPRRLFHLFRGTCPAE